MLYHLHDEILFYTLEIECTDYRCTYPIVQLTLVIYINCKNNICINYKTIHVFNVLSVAF